MATVREAAAVEPIHRRREFRRIYRSVEGDRADIGSTRECVYFCRRKELGEDLVADVYEELRKLRSPSQHSSLYYPWGAFIV